MQEFSPSPEMESSDDIAWSAYVGNSIVVVTSKIVLQAARDAIDQALLRAGFVVHEQTSAGLLAGLTAAAGKTSCNCSWAPHMQLLKFGRATIGDLVRSCVLRRGGYA
jgi:hypothetical protein